MIVVVALLRVNGAKRDFKDFYSNTDKASLTKIDFQFAKIGTLIETYFR